MALIGYARVSTEDQNLGPQLDALRAAGCVEVFEEFASGASRSRPQLAAALTRIRRGDTLVVARIDRLARSLSHLLAVIEGLRSKGAHFRSLADPIDTSGPSGVLVLQMLGAVAEFERSLIRERTKAGLHAARLRGRVGGNPGLRTRDPEVLRKLAASRRASRLKDLLPSLDAWLPIVRKLRPARAWPDVTDVVNAALPVGQRRFITDRLISAVKLLAAEGLVERELLSAAPRRTVRKGMAARKRTMEVAAALVSGRSSVTLAQVGIELARLGLTPPRGGTQWAPSSVRALLDQARMVGLLTPS
ncbi:MAG: recombinase family protein [Acetobacteraceae bacterium]|nr:recombinase family protein [Acetobacteraceae bacterium]MBV8588718.1 recombinase family protein [Acetobacteraceae bacterium]